MKLSELFTRCLTRSYTRIGDSVDYAVETEGDRLYVYFAASDGEADWQKNFAFPPSPYRDASGTRMVHRGFLTAWLQAEPYVLPSILDPSVREAVTVGYSHGAALAALCHEKLYCLRPDLRATLLGYGFAAPRVMWGCFDKRRWEGFTVIRNLDDLITHLPPSIFGYRHVGRMLEIGEKGRYGRLEAHRPESMTEELLRYEENGSNR